MTSTIARKLLCAVLAALLFVSVPVCAPAESGSPFEDSSEDITTGNNPFADPTPTINAAELFNLSTPVPSSIGTNPGNDPFGGAASSAPVGETISGYNPFDPNSSVAPAVNQVMYVTASTTKIHRSANEKSGVLATVSFGQQLTVTATQDDWATVTTEKGKNGYCKLEALSYANPNTLSQVMYVQPKRIAFYRTPDRHSGNYRWLNAGETVTMVAIASDGMWARVTDGTNYGFIPTIALDDASPSQGTPMWCGAGSTPVLVNPSQWTEISTLSLGQPVYLVGYTENNAIAKIRSDSGYVAYCDASALVNADPLSTKVQMYAQTSGRILFRSASETARTANVGKNASLLLLGLDNTQYWAAVRYAGRVYYTPYIFLGANRPGKGYKVVTATQDVQLYRNSTEVIATLPAGTRMYLTGIAGTNARVTTISDGTNATNTGYVPIQYLKSE